MMKAPSSPVLHYLWTEDDVYRKQKAVEIVRVLPDLCLRHCIGIEALLDLTCIPDLADFLAFNPCLTIR